MGSVVQGALSAIDIALWDIKGKRLGVPIYDLMGGKTRDKVRCYMHVGAPADNDTADGLAQHALEVARDGFTAVPVLAVPERLLSAQVLQRLGGRGGSSRRARCARRSDRTLTCA